MNELPWHGVFLKRAIDYWINGESDDVITRSMLLLKFKDINGNEVQ